MRSELVDSSQNTFAVVFERGEEIIGQLEAFAREKGLNSGHFTGIGAFSYVVLGFYDWEKKDYRRIHVDQQVEILSLVGDIATRNGSPELHPHVVISKADGTAQSGQLLEGYARSNLELVIEGGAMPLPQGGKAVDVAVVQM